MKQQKKASYSGRYDIEGRYAALLKAGEMLLCQGYDYAKPQEIAKSAGVSVGLFYRHFKNKQELLTAIMVKHLSRLHQEIKQQVQQESDPVAALNLVLYLTLSYFQRHQGLIQLFFMQVGYGNTTATERLRNTRQNYRDILEAIIVAGTAQDRFLVVDFEIAINSIVGTINWTLYDLLVVKGSQIESEQLTPRLLAQILRGLGAKTETKLKP